MENYNFVFPEGLDLITRQRLHLPEVPAEWFGNNDFFATRVSEISFRKPGQMTFCLDGRKSGTCHLTPEEKGWLDAGIVTPKQMAAHYAANRYTHFSRNPIQKTLFD